MLFIQEKPEYLSNASSNDSIFLVIKLINLSILLIFFGFPCVISAQEVIEQDFFEKHFDWSRTLKKYRLNLKTQRSLKTRVAFCFKPEQGSVKAINYKEPMRIASLSKLYTSMWAISQKGANYSFQTFASYNKDLRTLYIWGFDPLFSVEHIFKLIKKLNDHEVTQLDQVIVSDQLTLVRKNAQFAREYRINSIEKDLKKGRNHSYFRRAIKTDHRYHKTEKRKYLKFSPNDAVEFSNLKLSVKNIGIKPASFFEQGDINTWLSLSSKPLSDYLKIMNTESYNKLADLLFDHLGGQEAFKNYFKKLFGEESKKTQLYTGSGLNLDIGSKRYDNISTCETVLFVLQNLREQLSTQTSELPSKKSLKDILAYAGNGEGTLEKRFKTTSRYDHQYIKPFVAAKTGSLYQRPTSAISGVFGQKSGIEQDFALITEYRAMYWRDKNKKLHKSYPKAKRFEEEVLGALHKHLDNQELDNPVIPIHSSLQEITETLSVIDK